MIRIGPNGNVLRLSTALLGLALALSACLPAASPPASPSSAPPSTRVTAPPGSQGPVSPVVGIVIAVDPAAQASAAGSASASPAGTFAKVIGFTLQTSDGQTMAFTLGELDNAADFPDHQLYDRLASGDSILVFFKIVGDKLVVYHIEDAG